MTVRTQLLNPVMRMPCMVQSRKVLIAVRQRDTQTVRCCNSSSGEKKKKIVAVLPKGGPAAENPKYLNCVENGLGLREWLEESGHAFIATADKEGSDSGPVCKCSSIPRFFSPMNKAIVSNDLEFICPSEE